MLAELHRAVARARLAGGLSRRARMGLKIYGIPRSRAFRILWMAKELGIDYDNVPIDMGKGETRTPEFLAINPNGHIPAIEDNGLVLWESMVINLYLAKKHGAGTLYPARIED